MNFEKHTIILIGRWKRYALGLEAADVMVRAIGVIGSLGLSVDDLFTEVMDNAETKYDPAEIRRLIDEDGMNLKDAMAVMKGRWNGNGNTP